MFIYYSTAVSFYHIRAGEPAKYASVLHSKIPVERGRSKNKMAGLDLDETNLDVFSTFQLDVLDDELITADNL